MKNKTLNIILIIAMIMTQVQITKEVRGQDSYPHNVEPTFPSPPPPKPPTPTPPPGDDDPEKCKKCVCKANNKSKPADPIFLKTGEFFYNCEDLKKSGKGIDLRIIHTYRGLKLFNQQYGFGWYMSYHYRIRELSNGNIILQRGDGRKGEFRHQEVVEYRKGKYWISQGGGCVKTNKTNKIPIAMIQLVQGEPGRICQPAPIITREVETTIKITTQRYYPMDKGFYEVIEKTATGYELKNNQGQIYEFDNEGKLIKIKDKNNNEITFQYTELRPTNGYPYYGREEPEEPIVVAYDYKLTRIIDTLGNNIDFEYEENGHLRKIIDRETQREIKYEYDADTYDLIKITKKGGEEEYPEGITKRFEYDENHRMTKMINEEGEETVINTYDRGKRRVKTQRYGELNITYSYQNNQTTETTDEGTEETTYFNNEGQILRKEVADTNTSYVESYTYNNIGQQTEYERPLYNGIKWIYDTTNPDITKRNELKEIRIKEDMRVADRGTIDKIIRIEKETIKTKAYQTITTALLKEYFKNGVIQLNGARQIEIETITGYKDIIIDERGNKTEVEYDKKRRPTKITKQLNQTEVRIIENQYNNQGQIKKETIKQAEITGTTIINQTKYTETEYTYNTKGQIIRITEDKTGINKTTEIEYNIYGNIKKIKDSNNNTIEIKENGYGWIKEIIDAEGRKIKFTNNKKGKIIGIRILNIGTGQYETIETREYDQINQLTKRTDAKGNETKYEYTKTRRIKKIIDAKENETEYIYNTRGQIKTITRANQGEIIQEYDQNGRLITITDEEENTTTYSYDKYDRIKKEQYQDRTERQYKYDKADNIKEIIHPDNNRTTNTYDKANRLIRREYTTDTTLNTTYEYDIINRLTKTENPQSIIQLTYDKLNRLQQETQTINNQIYTTRHRYNKETRTQTTYPGGKTINYEYNKMKQITKIKQDNKDLINYEYDYKSQRTKKEMHNQQGTITQETVYSYNNIGQLTSIINQAKRVNEIKAKEISKYEYTYDRIGNRKTLRKSEKGIEKYTYNEVEELKAITKGRLIQGEERIEEVKNYIYDKVGNRTRSEGKTYETNNLNQYTRINQTDITYDKNGNQTKTKNNRHTYDETNRLKQTSQQDGTIIKYKYDGLNRRIKKQVNNKTTYYIYNQNQVIQEQNENNQKQAEYIYGVGIDETITMERNGTTYYYNYDGLGSTREITTEEGSIKERYEYTAFGEPIIIKVNGTIETEIKESQIKNNYLFTGRRYDKETELYYYRARMYYPKTGKFLQRDPLGFVDSMNLYTYVANNPVNYVDPFGEFIQIIWFVVKVYFVVQTTIAVYKIIRGCKKLFFDTRKEIKESTEFRKKEINITTENGFNEYNSSYRNQRNDILTGKNDIMGGVGDIIDGGSSLYPTIINKIR